MLSITLLCLIPNPSLLIPCACLLAFSPLPVCGFSYASMWLLVSFHLSDLKLTEVIEVGDWNGSSRVILLPDGS